MSDHRQQEAREHALRLRVFSMSSGMVGVCLAAIGILLLAGRLFAMAGLCAVIASPIF